MFNNKNKTRTIVGTLIGASMGLILGSKMTNMNRKKVMKKARKAGENVKDGLDSWWN